MPRVSLVTFSEISQQPAGTTPATSRPAFPIAVLGSEIMLLLTAVEHTSARDVSRVEDTGADASLDAWAADLLDELSDRFSWPNAIRALRAACQHLSNLLVADVRPIRLGERVTSLSHPRSQFVRIDC